MYHYHHTDFSLFNSNRWSVFIKYFKKKIEGVPIRRSRPVPLKVLWMGFEPLINVLKGLISNHSNSEGWLANDGKGPLVISMKISPSTETGTSYRLFATICDEICILPSFNLILDIPITKLTELWLQRQKIGINEPKNNENRGVHSKSFICTGTGHCPSSDHSYIKATHHEWSNSKEERFPLWLPRTPLLCLTALLWLSQVIYSKGDLHYKDIPSLLWNFQYREPGIMPV